MSLPFLPDPKKMAASAVEYRKKDGNVTHEHEDDSEGLLSAAHSLIQAVYAKDAESVAAALKHAFYICDSEPHEEGGE